jgi:hypothetical protein
MPPPKAGWSPDPLPGPRLRKDNIRLVIAPGFTRDGDGQQFIDLHGEELVLRSPWRG